MEFDKPPAFISISIDLVGSTNLKREIHKFCGDDTDNIVRLYKEVVRHLYDIEMNFYQQMYYNGMDIERLFVIKTIGDEVWLLFDLEGIDINSIELSTILHAIIKSLMAFSSNPLEMRFLNRELTKKEIYNPELQFNSDIEIMGRLVPIKVYIDLVEVWEDATQIREETFNRRSGSLFPWGSKESKYSDEEKTDILNRLNTIASIKCPDSKVFSIRRTDPIGFDVDHFFRCSKAAKPCVIVVGKKMIDCLKPYREWELSYDTIIREVPLSHGTENAIANDFYDIIWERIPSEDLKGIGEEYQVCNIFPAPLTFGRVFQKPIIEDEVEIEILKDTIELLKKVGIQGMDPKED